MTTKPTALSVDQFTSFGDLLKYLRRRAGLTQRELSIAVGYSDAMICRLEQNQRQPDPATLQARFAPALDLQDEPRLLQRLLELAAAVRREDAPEAGLPPFKGLRYFDETDSDLFFGREALTARLVARVMATLAAAGTPRFLAVLGASGSGKSSLVRAGLIPALRWQAESADWPIQVFTPTAHPLDALAGILIAEPGRDIQRSALAADLARASGALQAHALAWRASLRPAAAGRVMLLVVDQLEELFTLCRDAAERRAFVDNLLTAASAPGGPVCLVLALRADFYANCAEFPLLRAALAQQQEYIGAMTAEELHRAIEEPARRGGWEFEAGLMELLGDEVAGEPGALPLLAHALLETWQRRRGRLLTLSGYFASGGVRGAIAETAEAVFNDQLNAPQRAVARQIFLRLTEFAEDEAAPNTRRRVALNELSAAPDSSAAVREVLTILADARLVTTERDTAEVAHEALLREWPALRGWLAEDREGLRLHRRLTEAAQDWERSGQEASELYRGGRLAQALEWAGTHAAELNRLEQAFLQAAQALADREAAERDAQRRQELAAAQKLGEAQKQRAEEQTRAAGQLRRRALYLLGAFVTAILLAATAAYFANRATQVAAAAQDASRLATARELAADAVNTLAIDPERSVLLALQAAARADLPETEGALHQAVMADRLQMTLAGHQGEVWSVAYSHDGQRLATASQDKTARVWDAATGKLLLTLSGHTDSVDGIAFSPDDTRLATTGDDGTARVWDAATGAPLLTLAPHPLPVLRVAFSPDGARLATTSVGDSLQVWEAASGKLVFSVAPPANQFYYGVAYSPDGSRLAATLNSGPTQILDTHDGQLITSLDNTEESYAVAFSPDGTRVAVASRYDVLIWDVASGHKLLTLKGHTDIVRAVAFSPDGRRLITGATDRKAIVWDAATGQPLIVLNGHAAAVSGVAVSPDGRHVATSSPDHTAKIWDLSPAHEWLSIGAPALDPGPAGVVAVSPDGSRVAVPAPDFITYVFEAATGRQLLALKKQSDKINAIAFSPDGTRLATVSQDRTLVVWDAHSGQANVSVPLNAISIAFGPDSRRLIATSGDGDLALLDAVTGQTFWHQSIASVWYTRVAFNTAGTRIATGMSSAINPRSGTAIIADAATGQILLGFADGPNVIWSVVFSPDGTRLATASEDGTAQIFDAATGKPRLTLSGHTGPVTRLAFSPDGTRLATTSPDGTARLWDTVTGQQLLLLYTDNAKAPDLAFSPDGARLYLVTDQALRVYALKLTDLMALARARVTRALTPAECQQYLHTATCP